MGQELKSNSVQNSFSDALQSEMAAGSDRFSNWIRQVHIAGAADTLFSLETWLKGMGAFLDLQHLPLSEAERAELPTRSFGPEIKIVRRAIQISESYACALIRPEVSGAFNIEEFIRGEIRKDRLASVDQSHGVQEAMPVDSIDRLVQCLNDLRVMIDGLNTESRVGCQLFASLGRMCRREIESCRYIRLLLKQGSRLQSSLLENQSLAKTLRGISDDATRRDIVEVLAELFQCLKCLKLVRSDLAGDHPLKQNLVIFSLLHQEMGGLSEFIRTHFIKRRDTERAFLTAAELVSYSIREESQRVLNRELPFVAREKEPSRIYTRIENSEGLLRNCCESGILTLLQAIDENFDAASLFPSRAERLVSTEKLRKGIWELRQWLLAMVEGGEDPDSNKIVERFVFFRDTSLPSLMYRDWETFEVFLDSVTSAGTSSEIRARIRKFAGFLETLIQEISKRHAFQARKSS